LIKIGEVNKLKVLRKKDYGYFLDGQTKDTSDDILLPKQNIIDENRISLNQDVEVFVYKDSQNRLVATQKEPKAMAGQVAILEVCDNSEIGSFIGWKKASVYIVELEILSDAKRSSGISRKCRCDKAKVVAIENLDGSESHITEVDSNYDKTFIYRVGEVVSVDNFDENRWNECAPGIHFFITREEAARY